MSEDFVLGFMLGSIVTSALWSIFTILAFRQIDKQLDRLLRLLKEL